MELKIFGTILLLFKIFLLLFRCKCFAEVEDTVLYLSGCDDSLAWDMDFAKIKFSPIKPTPNSNLSVYAVNSNCYKCSWTFLAEITTDEDQVSCVAVYTPYPWKFYLTAASGEPLNIKGAPSNAILLDQIEKGFGDRGEYDFNVITTDAQNLNIQILETKSPNNSMLPFYILVAIITSISVVSFVGPVIYREVKRRRQPSIDCTIDPVNHDWETTGGYSAVSLDDNQRHETQTLINDRTKEQTKKKSPRLSSLDTFRGFSLTVMIFVNYGGGGYWFFSHADWNGLTVADLVFPFFMWMQGVSMALSFNNILPSPTENSDLYKKKYYDVWVKVSIRSVKLFLIGMFLANGYDYTTWRVPGVLQYFAASYFMTSATVLLAYSRTKALIKEIDETERLTRMPMSRSPDDSSADNSSALASIYAEFIRMLRVDSWSRIMTAYRYEWPIQAAILILYLSVALGVAAPGCPRGYNGPGGIANYSEHESCTGGIHRYIDMKTFGYDFIYHHPTCLGMYYCKPYDPEGLLGALSAGTLTYLGLLAGRVILHYKSHVQRLSCWLGSAICWLLLGGILCGFSRDEGVIPVNKNLWSTSFVLVLAGFGLCGLSVCYIVIDIYHLWSGAPFLYMGMNSIILYVGHSLLEGYMPFSYILFDYNHGTVLAMNVVGTVSWMIVAFYFYRIKFFPKV